MSVNNRTVDYYNENADAYFEATADADLSDARERFVSYLGVGAEMAFEADREAEVEADVKAAAGVRIIDVGCGSGRDAAAFREMGYEVRGLDASDELARVAARHGIDVDVCDMASWVTEEPFDGVWCCASLLHLNDDGVEQFFRNLPGNVADGGTVFISVKTGIETGFDDKGRFMRNFAEDEIRKLLEDAGFTVKEVWYTDDGLGRDDVKWINMIAVK